MQSVQHDGSKVDYPTLMPTSDSSDTQKLQKENELQKENAELRDLVVQLSNIVVRVVVKND